MKRARRCFCKACTTECLAPALVLTIVPLLCSRRKNRRGFPLSGTMQQNVGRTISLQICVRGKPLKASRPQRLQLVIVAFTCSDLDLLLWLQSIVHNPSFSTAKACYGRSIAHELFGFAPDSSLLTSSAAGLAYPSVPSFQLLPSIF